MRIFSWWPPDFDDEERVVYDIIKTAGNKGIWSRDIRNASNLPMTQVTKVLKHLESKKIIKSVKSVAAGKKKVYMLAEIEPDRSVTGGVWYEDQHFEQEFIDVLHRYCAKFIQQKYEHAKEEAEDPRLQFQASLVSIADVMEHIKATQVSKIELKREDIESVLDAVCYDGIITRHVQVVRNAKTKQTENVILYRYRPSLAGDVGALYTPCSFCPVIKDCDMSSEINPRTCAYITDWLSEDPPSTATQVSIKSEPPSWLIASSWLQFH